MKTSHRTGAPDEAPAESRQKRLIRPGRGRRPRLRSAEGQDSGQVERPWISPRDLWTEALSGVLARPVRSALTTLGTVLGIGTLVITIGVASTAANQIVGRFDALTATSVTVVVPPPPPSSDAVPLADWRGVDAVDRLAGVESSAALAESDKTAAVQVRANDVVTPGGVSGQTLAVVAASPSLPTAVRGAVTAGRFYDTGDIDRHERVAVLGDQAARLLGIKGVADAPAVFFDGHSFTVIGILGGFQREQRLSTSVILPPTTARDRLGLDMVNRVLINTSLGAAQQVARQSPTALSPNNAKALTVLAPPDLSKARKGVQGDVNGLFLVLGLVSLIVGAIGIANVTLVTVMERVGEIGLRRALGASRRQIAGQFLMESTMIGLLGGVIGASLGVVVVVSASALKDWTPVLDSRLALGAPVAGALVGLLAGVYPALRASRMEPVEALRAPS
ncbi:ABC transporter permease [Streptomyces shenzhenensis]|uniref:ABC transporter n=1 Tax=Streptomyces shenzhenensis TaxID=943815 RepID=A0A3M0IPQ3_9ACTN|nr:ABC transporter permease [Streptomyces shenzhenensis]RMB84056.1 ABC transporter [Streptomyces shenzhenensis]